MSRESVSQTDSSRVLVWARRSSPGMAEVRALGLRGAVSRGSSRSLISTGEKVRTRCRAFRWRGLTVVVVGVDDVLFDPTGLVVVVGVYVRARCHDELLGLLWDGVFVFVEV